MMFSAVRQWTDTPGFPATGDVSPVPHPASAITPTALANTTPKR
jgi:hypothetical protein